MKSKLCPALFLLSCPAIGATVSYHDDFERDTSAHYVLIDGPGFQVANGMLAMNVGGGVPNAVHVRTSDPLSIPVGATVSLTFVARDMFVAHEMYLSADPQHDVGDDAFLARGAGGWTRTGQDPSVFRAPGSDAAAIFVIERTGLNTFKHWYQVGDTRTPLGTGTTTGLESFDKLYVIVGGFRDAGASRESVDDLTVTIPEPSVGHFGLLGVPLGALGVSRRKHARTR